VFVHSDDYFYCERNDPHAMAHDKTPVTPAVRMLREWNVEYTEHLYDYVEKGGTAVSSRALGVDEHVVIKTLIMERTVRSGETFRVGRCRDHVLRFAS
jgi:hypothetical protein